MVLGECPFGQITPKCSVLVFQRTGTCSLEKAPVKRLEQFAREERENTASGKSEKSHQPLKKCPPVFWLPFFFILKSNFSGLLYMEIPISFVSFPLRRRLPIILATFMYFYYFDFENL